MRGSDERASAGGRGGGDEAAQLVRGACGSSNDDPVHAHICSLSERELCELVRRRKYGTKKLRGHEFPRHYFTCSVPSCCATMRVERDLSGNAVLIEHQGEHNHSPAEGSASQPRSAHSSASSAPLQPTAPQKCSSTKQRSRKRKRQWPQCNESNTRMHMHMHMPHSDAGKHEPTLASSRALRSEVLLQRSWASHGHRTRRARAPQNLDRLSSIARFLQEPAAVSESVENYDAPHAHRKLEQMKQIDGGPAQVTEPSSPAAKCNGVKKNIGKVNRMKKSTVWSIPAPKQPYDQQLENSPEAEDCLQASDSLTRETTAAAEVLISLTPRQSAESVEYLPLQSTPA